MSTTLEHCISYHKTPPNTIKKDELKTCHLMPKLLDSAHEHHGDCVWQPRFNTGLAVQFG